MVFISVLKMAAYTNGECNECRRIYISVLIINCEHVTVSD